MQELCRLFYHMQDKVLPDRLLLEVIVYDKSLHKRAYGSTHPPVIISRNQMGFAERKVRAALSLAPGIERVAQRVS